MRLIDADALIEAMKKTESEYENAMTCPSWWSAFNVISEQPTAYDIDKVVEELEELKVIKDGSIPIIHGKAELELHDKAIRNKAIDDFAKACKEDISCQTFGLHINGIERIAKQLKAGGDNDNLRR